MLLTSGPYSRLSEIPFFFEPLETPDHSAFPATLPFDFYLDDKLEILRQKGRPELSAMLRRVYENGSMLAGAMNESVGRAQADAAERFACSVVAGLGGQRVLEIGSGSGYLLQRFHAKGAICTGLEPGPQVHDGRHSGIRFVQDFFPSEEIDGSYDLVLHFTVLEHMEDPEKFLGQQRELLSENGRIVLGVPNCEPYLPSGDISMFVHEHYSYFTRRGLHRLAEVVGLSIEAMEVGANGGMLFASMTAHSPMADDASLPALVAAGFSVRAEAHLNSVATMTTKFSQEELAVYCPIRAMNALCLLGATQARLVDDNPMMHGGYIPGFSNAIEDFENLQDAPPAAVLIFSRTFGHEIKIRCEQSDQLRHTPIHTIEEFDRMPPAAGAPE